MAREIKPRDHNRYPAPCRDCGTDVPALAGWLYRHSGANLGRMKKSRNGRFAYLVRCDACAKKRGDERVEVAKGQVESSGVGYYGYGGNSHAPCGN